MFAAWLLGTASLMATTVAALLIFLYLWRAPELTDVWQTPEGKRAYALHRRRLIVSVGLLAAWLLVQNLAVILI